MPSIKSQNENFESVEASAAKFLVAEKLNGIHSPVSSPQRPSAGSVAYGVAKLSRLLQSDTSATIGTIGDESGAS